MTMLDEEHRPPSPTDVDTVQAVARVILAHVPIIGAPPAELLGLLVTPSLERRRQAWMEEVGEALRRLEAAGRRPFTATVFSSRRSRSRLTLAYRA